MINNNVIKMVFESIQYLLTAGAVMAIGAAVIKYQTVVVINPTANFVAGAILIIIGLGLSLWAWLYYLLESLKDLKSIWGTLIVGFFIFMFGQ